MVGLWWSLDSVYLVLHNFTTVKKEECLCLDMQSGGIY